MKRIPNGAHDPFFFQKRAPTPRPDWIATCSIEHASASVIDFPIVRDLASLRWIINLGCIDLPYQPGERTSMQKVKRLRTADCVVGGFRYATGAKVVGSLLLGLYDANRLLHHVGFCSGLSAGDRRSLNPKLEKLIRPPGFTGRAPGGLSRWSKRRSMEWQPLRPGGGKLRAQLKERTPPDDESCSRKYSPLGGAHASDSPQPAT